VLWGGPGRRGGRSLSCRLPCGAGNSGSGCRCAGGSILPTGYLCLAAPVVAVGVERVGEPVCCEA
jgi:hypothetical protein